jgi:hypothetical protein
LDGGIGDAVKRHIHLLLFQNLDLIPLQNGGAPPSVDILIITDIFMMLVLVLSAYYFVCAKRCIMFHVSLLACLFGCDCACHVVCSLICDCDDVLLVLNGRLSLIKIWQWYYVGCWDANTLLSNLFLQGCAARKEAGMPFVFSSLSWLCI